MSLLTSVFISGENFDLGLYGVLWDEMHFFTQSRHLTARDAAIMTSTIAGEYYKEQGLVNCCVIT